ncbi:MAG: hypothetical protein GWQ05_07405 [Verrucomicrobiaceae bacterium]|nr:hypothetical protein [Verrucomicrobiaceae bacterium]
MRDELSKWYKMERGAGHEYTQVQNLTASMFGTTQKPELNLHGSEKNSFLMFCQKYLMPTYGFKLRESGAWLREIRSLVNLLDIMHEFHDAMPTSEVQRFVDNTVDHIRQCKVLGLHGIQKHHFLMEMSAAILRLGPPAWYACWRDEGLNGIVKRIVGSTHRSTWALRTLQSFAELPPERRS